MVLVTVYDCKAQIYTLPHVSQTKETAIREFGTLVNDGGKTMISQHPEDYSLFQVGEWIDRVPVEDETAEFSGNIRFTARLVALRSFECLANGIDLVRKS